MIVNWLIDIFIVVSLFLMRWAIVEPLLLLIKFIATFTGSPAIWDMWYRRREDYNEMLTDFKSELDEIDATPAINDGESDE